jgi:hypothetical protein
MRSPEPITDADFEFAIQIAPDGFIIYDTGLPATITDRLDALPENPPQVLIDNIHAAWEQLKRERPEDFT